MLLNLQELKNKYNMEITGVIHIGAHFGEEHPTYKSLGLKNQTLTDVHQYYNLVLITQM